VCLCGVCVSPTPLTAPCARMFVGCVCVGAIGIVSMSPLQLAKCAAGATSKRPPSKIITNAALGIIIAVVVGAWTYILLDMSRGQEGQRGSGGVFRLASMISAFARTNGGNSEQSL
jgi:hypothetical protein